MKALAPLLCALLLSGPVAGARAADVPPPSRTVLVSIPPQQFIVERIGGPLVAVRVMLEPGHAPENYDPTPARMAEAAGAALYFAIGVPFERAWLPELARQNPGLEVVACCDQFTVAPGDAAGHDDPHVWMAPLQFLRAARLVHDALVQRDVGNRAVYGRNYRKLSEEFTMLHRDLRYLLKGRRIDDFIISHGSLGPLADAYGLRQVALEAGGRELGPRALTGVVDLARRQGIRTVFVQAQHPRGPATALAREVGAELVQLDPLAADYLRNMRAIGRALAAATR